LQRVTADYASHRTFVSMKYGTRVLIITYIVPADNLYWILENFANISLTRKHAKCHGTYIGTLYGTVLNTQRPMYGTIPYGTGTAIPYHIVWYRTVPYRTDVPPY